MKTTKPHRTQSIGTRLTPEQRAIVQTQAEEQGLELSEYIRTTLLSSPSLADTLSRLESLLQVQIAETLALRTIVLNLASVQASGEPLTAERLRAVRAYADDHKAARAQMLLVAKSNHQTQLAASSENKEAA